MLDVLASIFAHVLSHVLASLFAYVLAHVPLLSRSYMPSYMPGNEEEEYPMRADTPPPSSDWVLPFDQPRREEGGGQGEQLPVRSAPQLLAAPQQLEQFG